MYPEQSGEFSSRMARDASTPGHLIIEQISEMNMPGDLFIVLGGTSKEPTVDIFESAVEASKIIDPKKSYLIKRRDNPENQGTWARFSLGTQTVSFVPLTMYNYMRYPV